MCYLVSSLPPATNTGVRQTQMHTFEQENPSTSAKQDAQLFAERQVLAGHTEVRVWKLVDEAELVKAVEWKSVKGISDAAK